MEYDKCDPFGEKRADLRSGIVAANVANFAGRQLKEGEWRSASDFMPRFETPPEDSSDADEFDAEEASRKIEQLLNRWS